MTFDEALQDLGDGFGVYRQDWTHTYLHPQYDVPGAVEHVAGARPFRMVQLDDDDKELGTYVPSDADRNAEWATI